MVTDSDTRTTIALTRAQRLSLLEGCVPFAIILILVGGYVVMALIGSIPYPPVLVTVVIVVVFVALGYQVTQVVRDITSGVALVEEDVLLRVWRASGPSSDSYGKFERLGTMSLRQIMVSLPRGNMRYLVVYSPASKIVWSMEPTESYSGEM